jgi:hypothetical protein
MSDLKNMGPAVGWGVVGAAGTQVIPGMIGKFLPVSTDKTTSPLTYYGVKILSAIALGYVAAMAMGKSAGRHVMTGGILVTAAEAANQYALAPMGLAAYIPDSTEGVSAYLPSPVMGYMGAAPTVGMLGEEEEVTRLDPGRRL